ncbi:MAG TPA: tRNA pseudouridine(55) synthase TruB, partial [Clostridia bacterium]|nr:tRNA pseudouridine(55) synthase TruB [Clostridia bacterium]
MNGVINVLKPPGITSHDVVDIVRRLTGVKKVGHTGTLDPGAAGILPLCVGRATRVARFFAESNKSYRGELILGFATESQDIFSKINREVDASGITKGDFMDKMGSFRGEIKQIPPMYSAVRVRGKRLYESAREGKTIKREPRSAHI